MTIADLAQERQVTVEALVDTGATYVSLPASRARQLGIQPAERRTFVLAEGSEPLVAAVILETLGLAADPVGKKLVPVPSFLL
jgi:predicted aspartyl protease